MKIRAVVTSVRYYNETGYRIFGAKAQGAADIPGSRPGKETILNCKGYVCDMYDGQPMQLDGEFAPSKDLPDGYYDFHVKQAIPDAPSNDSEMTAFLVSVKGCGKKYAPQVCAQCHDSIDELSKLSVKELIGIGIKKTAAARLHEKATQFNGYLTLAQKYHGILTDEDVNAIVSKYDIQFMKMVSGYSYQFVKVIGFPKADKMAIADGIDQKSYERTLAVAKYVYGQLCIRFNSIMVYKTDFQRGVYEMATMNTNDSFHTEEELAPQLNRMVKEGHFVVQQNKTFVYSTANYNLEVSLATDLYCMAARKVEPADETLYQSKIIEWIGDQKDMTLSDSQLAAVSAVGDHVLSIVTGGPGTGKTTTLKAIMDTYHRTYPKADITLIAPTGLAAKRMSDACGAPATTIHKAFNLLPNDSIETDDVYYQTDASSKNGLIIIDEMSMVSIDLFAYVANCIGFSPETRLVVVGDVDQLPPVTLGSVLNGMIRSGIIYTTRLDRNYRQEEESNIINVATAINSKDNTLLSFGGDCTFDEIDTDSDEKVFDEIKSVFLDSVAKYQLDGTLVLCPARRVNESMKINVCSNTINPILRDAINPASIKKAEYHTKAGKHAYRVGDRVINLKNGKQVVNGDIGYITAIVEKTITVDFLGTKVDFTGKSIGDLDLAYCLTVHKSQGSEFASVIMPIMQEHRKMLHKQLLYTAVTRARKNFTFIGDKKELEYSIRKITEVSRTDYLPERLQALAQKNGFVLK